MGLGYVKVETFVPQEALGTVLDALAKARAGRVGEGPYDSCATTSAVTGHWRPLAGAHPYAGEVGERASEPEIKIEVTVAQELLDDAVAAIRRTHPYEEPVIYAWPLLVP